MKESMQDLGKFAAKATYVFILVGGAIGILGVALFKTISSVNEDIGYQNTFSVEGKAKKKVALDTARVQLGVVLEDKTPVAVQEDASERYTKAIDAIKALNIPEEDIQTQSYNVRTVYEQDSREIRGYEINLGLTVIIRDTSPESALVSQVINAATESGFNSVNNLSFYLEDMESIQDEIKGYAIEDAKERAGRESKLAGLKIGDVVNMYSYNAGPYYGRGFAETKMMANDSFGMPDAIDLPQIQIQPGQTEVEISVTLEYEIL